MSESSNVAVVRMYWEQCWNARLPDRLGEVFHAEYTHGRTPYSPTLLAEIIRDTVRSFPDVQVRIDELADLGDTVITRTRFIGTHGGEYVGLSATGRPIEAPSLDVFFFRDGLVERMWHLFDHLPL
ncbi:MAG TPA: ester cyclase, partial [Mycobacteriales bacterium]|nr:ester cyclase [Mycobacteriales bacterium]